MQLQQTVKSFIRPGEQSGYVAECLEIAGPMKLYKIGQPWQNEHFYCQ
jgi:hypothetical protein